MPITFDTIADLRAAHIKATDTECKALGLPTYSELITVIQDVTDNPMQKPNFYAMPFEQLGSWVVANNVVDGETVYDTDFADIEEMYEAGNESEAIDEYTACAEEIWQAMLEAGSARKVQVKD